MPEKDKMTLHSVFLGINNSNKSNTLLFLAKAKCYMNFHLSEYQLFVKRDDVTKRSKKKLLPQGRSFFLLGS